MELCLRDLRIQYPGMAEPLLCVEDRRISAGTRLLIRGPSGTGKTSLLHILAALLDAHGGDVEVDGVALSTLSENQRCRWRRERVGIVFQRVNLIGHLTALENVLLGVFDRGATREQARVCLERMGLANRADAPAHRLSLGEQQRVAVARVTAGSRVLVLADEPTSSLDEENSHQVMRELLRKVGDTGILIVATHDSRTASYFDEAWTISGGRLH